MHLNTYLLQIAQMLIRCSFKACQLLARTSLLARGNIDSRQAESLKQVVHVIVMHQLRKTAFVDAAYRSYHSLFNIFRSIMTLYKLEEGCFPAIKNPIDSVKVA